MADSTTTPTSSAQQPASYRGNCHCGAVAFEMKQRDDTPWFPALKDAPSAATRDVIHCNCSICLKNGYLLVYPLIEDLTWIRGEDNLGRYGFGRQTNVHLFCRTCGTSVGIDMTVQFQQNDRPPRYGMNLRVFKDVDLDKFQYKKIDGWSKLEPPYSGVPDAVWKI